MRLPWAAGGAIAALVLWASIATGDGREGGEVPVDPTRSYAHFVEGNTLYSNQDLEGAVAEYRMALKYDPLHADTMCNLGSALQDLGDLRLARDYYQKAVRANPYHAVAHFNLGLMLHDEDLQTAIEHYQSAVETDPSMADAWSNLGSALHHENDLDEALACYQEAITLYETEEAYQGLEFTPEVLATLNYHTSMVLRRMPDSRCKGGGCEAMRMEVLRRCLMHVPGHALCAHALESVTGNSEMTRASPEYVKALFDYYATTFDESLEELNYSSPEKLRHILGSLRPRFREVFDAGCGTGLVGPLFRNISETLFGVDLSEGMLEAAYARDVYDALAAGDIEEVMMSRVEDGGHGDLIVAADVLVYIGDLESLFSSAEKYLEDGGLFAFTCELTAPEDCDASKGCHGYTLLSSGRFAHTKEYLCTLADRVGFQVIHYSEMSPRNEGGNPVPGQLVVLEKRGSDKQQQPAREAGADSSETEL